MPTRRVPGGGHAGSRDHACRVPPPPLAVASALSRPRGGTFGVWLRPPANDGGHGVHGAAHCGSRRVSPGCDAGRVVGTLSAWDPRRMEADVGGQRRTSNAPLSVALAEWESPGVLFVHRHLSPQRSVGRCPDVRRGGSHDLHSVRRSVAPHRHPTMSQPCGPVPSGPGRTFAPAANAGTSPV